MCVEKAKITDIESLVKLRIEYLKEDNGYLDNKDIDAIVERLPDYFRLHLCRDLFCYIIRDENEIVACAFLLIVEKPMSPGFINGRTGTVLNVYTQKPFRQIRIRKKDNE